jgi:hypothetical protein
MPLIESDLYTTPGFKVLNFELKQQSLSAVNAAQTESGALLTPWRVILLEENIGDLVINTVPLNLATPNQLEDTSWIKPGKTLWD